MDVCGKCNRLHREGRCPFCDTPSRATRALGAVGGLVTTMVMSACYGSPPTDFRPPDTGSTADTGAETTGDTGTEDTGSP